MNKCKYDKCKKPVEQTKGKRKKEYCNGTCRYLAFYHRNVKANKAAKKINHDRQTTRGGREFNI